MVVDVPIRGTLWRIIKIHYKHAYIAQIGPFGYPQEWMLE